MKHTCDTCGKEMKYIGMFTGLPMYEMCCPPPGFSSGPFAVQSLEDFYREQVTRGLRTPEEESHPN